MQILTKLLHIAAWVFAVIAIVSLFFNRNQRLVLHYYVRIIAIALLTVSTGALLLHLFT